MVEALGQYQRFSDKRGQRSIKKDVEIDISNESGFSKELPTIDQEMDSYFNSRKTTEDEQQVDENPAAHAALRGAGWIASKMNPANTGMTGAALSGAAGVATGIARAAMGSRAGNKSNHTMGSARTGSGYVSPGNEKNALDAMAAEDYLPEND